ncbi:hypothetical protein ACHAXS_012219 [Conticribra weissflogii]
MDLGMQLAKMKRVVKHCSEGNQVEVVELLQSQFKLPLFTLPIAFLKSKPRPAASGCMRYGQVKNILSNC